jgi:hypothetical protein
MANRTVTARLSMDFGMKFHWVRIKVEWLVARNLGVNIDCLLYILTTKDYPTKKQFSTSLARESATLVGRQGGATGSLPGW